MALTDDAPDTGPDRTHAKWLREIDSYEKLSDKWRTRGKDIIKRYMDRREANDTTSARYNILWSNIETLKPLLYSATPKAVVTRRFLDKDQVGNEVAQILERAIDYTLAEHYFGSCLRQAVVDYLLPGRGTVWARYVPHFARTGTNEAGPQLTDDQGSATVTELVEFEEAMPDYVHWGDFGHTHGRVWEEVTGVWRRVKLTRAQLKEHFGDEMGAAIPLDTGRTDDQPSNPDDKDPDQRATVYEIWDKSTLTVLFVSKTYPHIVKQVADPLGLPQFFPCPRPLYATLANDGLIPIPDYIQYQDQARELDNLTGRIAALTKAIKAAGVYDSSVTELERLLSESNDNRLIPVDQWAALSEKGGLPGAIQLLPMKEIMETLLGLYEARDKVKGDLYEITGMSDIIRGNTNPNETASAQKIKQHFVTMRLDERQREVQRFARNIVVIVGNIIARKFGQDTLAKMTGVKLFPDSQTKALYQPPQMGHNGGPPMDQQPAAPMAAPPPPPADWTPDDIADALGKPTWVEVMARLKNEPERNFSIDIETDSTVAADQEAQKEEATEFLTAIGGYIAQAAKAPPEWLPMLAQLMAWGVRRFPIGRDLEDKINALVTGLEKQAANPAPPPVDPKVELDKAKLEQDGHIAADKHSLEAARAQNDHQYRMADLHLKHMLGTGDLAVKRDALDLQSQGQGHTQAVDVAKHNLDVAKLHHDDHHRTADRETTVAEGDKSRAAASADKGGDRALTREEGEASRTHQTQEGKASRDHASGEAKAEREHGGAQKDADRKHATKLAGAKSDPEKDDAGNDKPDPTVEAMKEQTAAMKEHTKALMAKRKVVRGADDKIVATEVETA